MDTYVRDNIRVWQRLLPRPDEPRQCSDHSTEHGHPADTAFLLLPDDFMFEGDKAELCYGSGALSGRRSGRGPLASSTSFVLKETRWGATMLRHQQKACMDLPPGGPSGFNNDRSQNSRSQAIPLASHYHRLSSSYLHRKQRKSPWPCADYTWRHICRTTFPGLPCTPCSVHLMSWNG